MYNISFHLHLCIQNQEFGIKEDGTPEVGVVMVCQLSDEEDKTVLV